MKALFLTAGPMDWASSRMRCWWVAPHLGADCVEYRNLQSVDSKTEYNAVIFQKVVDIELAQRIRESGARVYWDVCDPAWWWEPERCREIAANVDGVVCSNENLQADFDEWNERETPSYTIADRLDLDHFPRQRRHSDVQTARLVWFGLASNRPSLFGAFPVMERAAANGYSIELTICDDKPDLTVSASFPVYHIQWSLQNENSLLSAHDVAVLPPYPGAWGLVKSNNKTLTAWASGLPVTDGCNYYQLEALLKYPQVRASAAAAGYARVAAEYSIEQSAREWEAILCG